MLNRWQEQCLEYADETLTDPPRWEWTKRVQGRGTLVQRFVLPLELCPTSNARMRGGIKQRFAEADLKKRAGEQMLVQAGMRKSRVPLGGRPLILAIRFTTQATDATSDWAKVPIDKLQVGPNGLGLIVDDSPRHVEIATWCEPAPQGRRTGFVLVEVWSGEALAKPKKRRQA